MGRPLIKRLALILISFLFGLCLFSLKNQQANKITHSSIVITQTRRRLLKMFFVVQRLPVCPALACQRWRVRRGYQAPPGHVGLSALLIVKGRILMYQVSATLLIVQASPLRLHRRPFRQPPVIAGPVPPLHMMRRGIQGFRAMLLRLSHPGSLVGALIHQIRHLLPLESA